MPLPLIQLPRHTQVRLYALRPKFLRATWSEPSANEQASDTKMATTWVGGAVERPTITGQTRLRPDGVQPIICL